jgi:coniferyl-aldehyde dehydrogenase
MVQEAEAAGVRVISLNGDKPDPALRQIPMYAVVQPPEHLACAQEEIFGPVTAVFTYRSMDEVFDRINGGPTPLAAYLVTRDDALAARFIEQVLSGGTGINVFGFQAADATLPFGGVGPSGIGCHSGYEGFLNYSHQKSVFKCEDDNVLMMAIKPPFGDLSQAFADAVLTAAN